MLSGRSHPAAVVVRLRPPDLERLERLARAVKLSPGEFAARCLERELGARMPP
ncbi:MAG: hypothetical protein HYZ29_16985 [Myxococcales bacterium]|nr:hypothetical protein [Myxococcales bacterium]